MSRRFFSRQPILSDEAVLDGDEAHHLSRVMRARPGDRCVLFDGTGAEYEAEIVAIRTKTVALRILRWENVDRELPIHVTIASPLPRGERERFLVEKLTELGVGLFVPLITSRGVVRPGDAAISRLQRTVVEASKQCGRNRLMQVSTPTDLGPFLQDQAGAEVRWIAHPGNDAPIARTGRLPPATMTLRDSPGDRRATVGPGMPICAGVRCAAVVGPEGGFAPEELAMAAALGWQCIHLGPRILRVETAAMALAVILACRIPSK